MSRRSLTFRAEGGGPPPEIRVRRLLKAALRHYRLRCVAIEATGGPKDTNKRFQTPKKEIPHEHEQVER